ncbi:YbaB/EbfC family nucleoid-associated protein [Actinocrispum wychmicini]|uniref:YbaB/EbfC DNA-binding family protein n=1 Tax=Actinocrispum wychmicini TaxID=1213861 RepID=A0A4R2JGG5_9PSEU|nr:YbaB/EbfC family nucleoid-associated protein [Actinocrispum wychmicini]TCO56016.1 YbaB/EbfC DNA-binding family protein [Actinocrispum wychmicini]
MQPDSWVTDIQSTMDDLQRKVAVLHEGLENATVTMSSPDEAVVVTIGPNGGLQGLSLGHRAGERTPTQLAGLIMQTVGRAQRRAAANVAEAFAPLGAGTEAMRMFATYQPPDDPDDSATTEPFPQEEPPAPRAAAPVPPAADDDEEEMRPW